MRLSVKSARLLGGLVEAITLSLVDDAMVE